MSLQRQDDELEPALTASAYRLRGRLGGEPFSAELGDGLQRLGRDADNDVVVDGEGVSRHHCLLLVGPGGVEVVDQKSKNGTFVDGERIDRAVVGVGAVLGFGHVELALEGLEAADARLALEIVSFDDVPVAIGEASPAPTETAGAVRRWAELDFPPGYVVGVSPAMTRLYAQVRPAARSRLPVLIVGETGAGKETVAQLVHRSSSRRDGPLVAVNCAAIPKDLLEAELFGIGDRVATGVAARRGKFRQADGGSLFLDEVGEMPAELQEKLLRVLQEGRVEPLGEAPRDVDVHLIAATNSELEELIDGGRCSWSSRSSPGEATPFIETRRRRHEAEDEAQLRCQSLGQQRLIVHGESTSGGDMKVKTQLNAGANPWLDNL